MDISVCITQKPVEEELDPRPFTNFKSSTKIKEIIE